MKTINFYLGIIGLLLVVFTACQNDDVLTSLSPSGDLKSVSAQGTEPANVVSVTLYAGQTTNVGSLVLTEVDTDNDGINDAVSATYELIDGWMFSDIHFWIGTSLSDMPQTKTGNPQIGKFPYKPTDVLGTNTNTHIIPFVEINYATCEASYVIAAHASVYSGSRTETAWAAGTSMNIRGSWATFFTFTLVDNNAPEITGSLPEIVVEGCSVEDAPSAVSTVSELEEFGLFISDTRTTDNNIVVSSTDEVTGTCPVEISRSYTITDECGNSATINQTIFVVDTTAPELTGQGSDLTINAPALPQFTAPTVLDECSSDVTLTSEDVSVVDGNSTIVTRTWTATDACGNTSFVSQTITVLGLTTNNNNITDPGECTSWQTETAFGGEVAGSGNAWWYWYDGSGVETIWAGQHINVGTVELSNGYLYITLTNGWELMDVSESVKIQGYNTLPFSRPAAGQFTTYKGTSLTVPVGYYPYYVIHLDVQKCSNSN